MHDGVLATWQDPSGTAVGALVNGTGYNARGGDYSSLDTAGIETRTTFDDDARTTSVVQNYSGDGNLVPGSGDQNLNETDQGQTLTANWILLTHDGVLATWQDPSGTAVGALVTGTGYNARGEDYSSLDTAGIETRTTFDDDARN